MFSRVGRRAVSAASVAARSATRLSHLPTPVTQTSRIISTTSTSKASSSPDPFVNGQSGSYIEEMYNAWLVDPKSVHLSWQVYFKNITAGGQQPAFITPPSILPSTDFGAEGAASLGPRDLEKGHIPAGQIMDHMKVQLLVRAYQIRGHHLARIDPLEITARSEQSAPELTIQHYGFKESDLDREFHLGSGILPGFLSEGAQTLTLRHIVERLQKTYCGPIGIEYGHIPDRGECDWLRSKIEVPTKYKYSKEEKLLILDRLMWSDSFERFVAQKYPTEKRFGLEGCESLIPGMKAMIDRAVELGINSVVMGMPHRGRLNVLSNVVRKPNESIFSEFAHAAEASVEGSGDVKYHLGMNYIRPTPSGKMVHLSLAANPSHLEAVNPVVEGKVRAIQFYQNDEKDRGKAMAVLLHGDAAFAGQGVVYETIGMADLPAYDTGGSIHIVVNNQVGFTTDPRFSRSTPYCSDVAKTVSAPIVHVNGDDVEAVVFAMQLASEWRQQFKKDFVVDIVCYRKYGHNEIDQPQFTQPLMYQKIPKMTPVVRKYIQQLLDEGSVQKSEIEEMEKRIWDILEENYVASKNYKASSKEWVSSSWSGFMSPAELASTCTTSKDTGVDRELLTHIGIASASYPSDFNVHPNLAKILKAREKSIKDGEGIDWATAEAMSFGSLLAEGKHVRLSGQDVERGTFSQRHALLHDQKNESKYIPLNNLVVADVVSSQSTFTVCNSHLSEFGVMGFELGYSMVSPHQLVLWEAQFGDFANNAQCIIDQFIAPGEQKWLQRTGLTLLLPHGYDGQGPEHSSGRLERFLQLCDEDPYKMPDPKRTGRGSYARQTQDCNMQVVYPTVPSNYFHILRRQVHRDFRKPLIAFTSKALLRHPLAKSSLEEMTADTMFQRLIPEVLHPNPLANLKIAHEGPDGELLWAGNNKEPRIPYALSQKGDFALAPPSETKTLIFCSGQIYYQLFRARAMNELKHVAIVRVEQLNPFPFWDVKEVVDMYGKGLEEVVWCQEESFNGGAWTFVEPRLDTAIRESEWYKSGKGKAWADKLEQSRVPGGLANARAENGAKELSIRGGRLVRYAGRDISAAPATGLKKQHVWEEKMLISEALLNGRLVKAGKVESGVPIFV
ncbi:2-oxoglutarate dehydrogenase E1 component [Rhizophlyctis rosea]|uniref:2-oxoglutarate dehydrogenase, mitochondrial n=1 Tax=Rhizophlyctis rosea TaxID=64517 RepID=A0AAD5WXX5_9FUNG|nr:2-oxoglutarate dehydrogenase E1 component [Rhizophlyctis rosea]